jgi:hypothetical protein
MIVTYKTRTDLLLTRPQTAHPTVGQHVILTPDGGVGQRYRVVDVEWPLHMPPRQYYSITDEADVKVYILLEPCQAPQAEDV